jgi:hypothetical protein
MQAADLDLRIISAKHELNDLMSEALYYADRAWGINNTDPEDWCPTHSFVLNSMAEMLLHDFLVLMGKIEDMIAVHNEHAGDDDLVLCLEWDTFLEEWDV